MSKFLLVSTLGFFALAGLTSCDNSKTKTLEISSGQVWREAVVVKIDEEGQIVYNPYADGTEPKLSSCTPNPYFQFIPANRNLPKSGQDSIQRMKNAADDLRGKGQLIVKNGVCTEFIQLKSQ